MGKAGVQGARVTNRLTGSRAQGVLKRIGGVAQKWPIPAFAHASLTTWFGGRETPGSAADSRGRVMLWPDTFTNDLTPQVGMAAVRVLEAAVRVLERPASRW